MISIKKCAKISGVILLYIFSACFYSASAQVDVSIKQKHFKKYLKFFSPVTLPIESFRTKPFITKGTTIPSHLVERFIDPGFDADNTWYEALGKVPHNSTQQLLLVKGESVTPDIQ